MLSLWLGVRVEMDFLSKPVYGTRGNQWIRSQTRIRPKGLWLKYLGSSRSHLGSRIRTERVEPFYIFGHYLSFQNTERTQVQATFCEYWSFPRSPESGQSVGQISG